ncbi:MAG: hypothetical protein JWQ71_410 [Pedosphaera sp.]|nr:hypothetical protein [Pedosphaera sp.]
MAKKKIHTAIRKGTKVPNLKSASGSPFTFEDKVAALLFCEMLAGQISLGNTWGITDKIERQASDWEPFGDLLLTVTDRNGCPVKCGCSVKSNRQFSANGCNTELCAELWGFVSNPAFQQPNNMVGMFCAKLSSDVSRLINQFCKQAREEPDPERLDQKITHAKHRKIYTSFRNPTDSADHKFPGHILARLIPREFDFDEITSRNEAEAIALCRSILRQEYATSEKSHALWEALLGIARDLRDVGGSVTRERLASKLRDNFRLQDDPSDIAAWTFLRARNEEWMEQIGSCLPGGLKLPRVSEMDALRKSLCESPVFHVIGESGSGKSALLKTVAWEMVNAPDSAEVVWIKADQFLRIIEEVPDFVEVLHRTHARSGLLLLDSLEACRDDILESIAKTVAALCANSQSPWRIILVCQTAEWSRVSRQMGKNIMGCGLIKRFECGDLSADDMQLVFEKSPSVRRLALQPRLRRILAFPKILDLLLSGQLQEDRPLVGEDDLVDWWWQDQVMGSKQFAAEEAIARKLATRMANELTTEVSPDVAEGPADAVESLIKRRVLRRTSDGRLRFDHDLLADWSRVMHLRTLGDGALTVMRANVDNPPWLRAIRLLSQHWLERASNRDQWRSVVTQCSRQPEVGEDPSAGDLQVLDALLEGIAYCTEAQRVLDSLRADLFAHDAWLFRRFVRRLLHTGTFPDPIIQERIQNMDASAVEEVAMLFRLPRSVFWQPVFDFMIANSNDTTKSLPVEVAESGAIWARLQDYLQLPWQPVADLLILNAEKELRREVAGEYRSERGTRSCSGGNKSRIKIYTAALQAVAHAPDQVTKLVLKAAGRVDWEICDLGPKVNGAWRGQWRGDDFRFGGRYVKQPPESWPDGPKRRVSDDFFHAWFESGAPSALYRLRPEVACEATLAFLIDWPRAQIQQGHHNIGIDAHGFRFDADEMKPPIWTKGPFLSFLKESWRPALDLIIRLTNFAVDRYEEWWPYEPRVTELHILTPDGNARWKGNHQVFLWSRSAWNTPSVVTCALMALEKWLDEQVAAGKPIKEAVSTLYKDGRSLAFAGLLIGIGKRHPELFIQDLKPLLFAQDLYVYDHQGIRQHFEPGFWPGEGSFIRNLRHEWNELPGRKTPLKEACHEWLLEKAELQVVLGEVSNVWRQEAEKLPAKSDEKLTILRWAADFDRSFWKEFTSPDGKKIWRCERPPELEDTKGGERLHQMQRLITLPHQCSDCLEKGQRLRDDQLESIWQQLQNWECFEQLTMEEGEDKDTVQLRDHRHARAGLLAVLLCAGDAWLSNFSDRRQWLEQEVRKILADPPKITIYSPDEIHDDCESLLARAVVRCWAHSPHDVDWRGHIASFVTAYRYHTVFRLFQEAFKIRKTLGADYRELEAFVVSFAVARKKSTQQLFIRTRRKTNKEQMQKWGDEWLPKFAYGKGPKWCLDWSKVEIVEPFPHEHRPHGVEADPLKELRRRDYGLDVDVILAAFGHFPSFVEASDSNERLHWLNICRELLAAFCRTLPICGTLNADVKWHYDHWDADRKILDIVASRLFECTEAERRELWQPILNLSPVAYHHINGFLNAVLIEPLRTDPPRIRELVPIWREIADFFFAAPILPQVQRRNRLEILKTILLYGSSAASSGEEYWLPIVKDLRPQFKKHLVNVGDDGHEQSSIAYFLTTKAGEILLVEAFEWLQPIWELASDWFWDIGTEDGHFSQLLEHAWHQMFDQIRNNPEALKAFKRLTLKLAARHIPIAMEVQQHLGN